jgi:hypothetical protein
LSPFQVVVFKPGLTAMEIARVSDEMIAKLDEEFSHIKTDKANVTTELIAKLAQR